MKQFFYNLIFSTAFICCLTGAANAQSATTAQDSINAKVSWLKQKLNLTDSQSTAVKAILLNANIQLDSAQRSSAPMPQRNAQLRLINKTFIMQVKNVFNADQWIRYQGLEATDTETFRQHAQQ